MFRSSVLNNAPSGPIPNSEVQGGHRSRCPRNSAEVQSTKAAGKKKTDPLLAAKVSFGCLHRADRGRPDECGQAW
jgi:hypothetical protein